MSNLRWTFGRHKRVRIAILGALVIFGGCSEQSQQEKRALSAQLRSWQEDSEYRQKLLEKIRKGDKAMPSEKPQMRANRHRS
jgi:hypothetical protein